MLKEITLKDAMVAAADGEKVLIINQNNGTFMTMEELLGPVFQNGIRFLQDMPEEKKKKTSTGKRPGRKPGRKPLAEKQDVDSSPAPDKENNSSEGGSGCEDADADTDQDESDNGPPTNKVSVSGKQPPTKRSQFIALKDNTEAVKRAVCALAMNKTQSEVASMLGVSQPTVSKIAVTYKKEIANHRTELCKSRELPQSTVDDLKARQNEPDDGSRKCTTCIYGSKTATGTCTYALVEKQPRGCVPWRCYKYRSARLKKALQAAD